MRSLRWLCGFTGRFSAGDLWAHHIGSSLLGGVITMVAVLLLPDAGVDALGLLPIAGVAMAIVYVAQMSTWVRRLHDFNLSGWWVAPYALFVAAVLLVGFNLVDAPAPLAQVDRIAWITFVLIAAGLFAVLYLAPGQREANRFGPVPRDRRSAPPE